MQNSSQIENCTAQVTALGDGSRRKSARKRSTCSASDADRKVSHILIKTGPEFRFVKQLVLVQIVKLGDFKTPISL